mgnify:CR=1 FL=1
MKTKYIVFVCLLAIYSNAMGQPQASGNVGIDSLNQQVKERMETADTAGLLQLAHEALNLAAATDAQEAFPTANRNLAIYHETFGAMDSALYYFERVKDFYYEQQDTTAMARAHLDINVWYGATADYPGAMKEVMSALALYEATGNRKGIANCYTALCDLLYYEDKYSESADYCQKAIEIQEDLGEQRAMAQALRFKASSLLFVDGGKV